MRRYNNNYIAVRSEGKFTLWINKPIYKEYFAGEGMKIVNTKTGEVMGSELKLYTNLYDADLRRLPAEIQDEDCYAIVGEIKNA